jgi:uncharacterized protein (TIGR00369 family)
MRTEELQKLLDTSPVHTALALKIRLAGDDLVLDAAPGPAFSVDGGSFLHGGVIATILDTAATFSLINATGTDWSTVDLRIDYLRPVPISSLQVTGRATQVGQRFGRAGAELSEVGTHRLLASAVGTFVRSA